MTGLSFCGHPGRAHGTVGDHVSRIRCGTGSDNHSGQDCRDGKIAALSRRENGLATDPVAAELNYSAGAGKTGAATTAINQAVVLLGNYQFNGITHTAISAADTLTMNALASTLDDYNNDR